MAFPVMAFPVSKPFPQEFPIAGMRYGTRIDVTGMPRTGTTRRRDALERREAMVATRSRPAKKLSVIACVPPCPRSIGMPLPKVSLQLLRIVGHTSRRYVVCVDQ